MKNSIIINLVSASGKSKFLIKIKAIELYSVAFLLTNNTIFINNYN